MATRWVLFVVLLRQSASQLCPDEYRCSPDSTPPDITSTSDKDLHMLDLSCKLIQRLETELFSDKNVAHLISVHLNDNCINSVRPEVFEPFVALRHLYLQNNQINDIHPATFQRNIHLITLDLSGNKVTKLHRNIFEKNHNLSWVNITGNPVDISDVQETLRNSYLNTIDIDTCNKPQYSINYFQQIPYLRDLNKKQNVVFTVKNLKSYQNIKPEEISLDNYVFSKLIQLGYNDWTELSYDRTQKVILSPSNSSLLCFCSRLSVWFWCFEGPLPCAGHTAQVYSLLNCNVTPTEQSLFHTSPSLSAPALSTVTSAAAATTDDQTNFATNTSTASIDPESRTVDNNWILYVVAGAAFLIVIIVIIIVIICRARRLRNNNVPERPVEYTSVSQNTYDPSSSTPHRRPDDIRWYNRRSPVYAIPHEANECSTFRPLTPISATRSDSIRHKHAEND